MSEIKEKVVSIIVDKLGVDPSEVVQTENIQTVGDAIKYIEEHKA